MLLNIVLWEKNRDVVEWFKIQFLRDFGFNFLY